jgi:hypothetical protein
MHISSHQQKAIKNRRQFFALNDMPLKNKAKNIGFKGFPNGTGRIND